MSNDLLGSPMGVESHVCPTRIVVDVVSADALELSVDGWGEAGFGLDAAAGQGCDVEGCASGGGAWGGKPGVMDIGRE
jgi:hypothetical protein